MSEWWTYRPGDFLLFSEQVYWRLFETLNASVWPWSWVAIILGASIPAVAVWRPRLAGRFACAVLAIGWIVAAWAALWQHYRPINWAVAYAVPVFAVQAAMLVIGGVLREGLIFRRDRNAGALLGWGLFVCAVALYPLAALAARRPLGGAEIFALAPDPTAIATLGLAAAACPGSGRYWLTPIPFLWCAASWATLATMGAWEAWLLVAAIVCAIVALRMNR
jgi:hypothetical protein